jgi:hypothetical protein
MNTFQPYHRLTLPPKKYMIADINESLKEYHELLDTLVYLHEKIIESKKPMKEYQLHSDTLITKFYFHSYSFYKLISGYEVSSNYYKKEVANVKVLDIYSALVILRAQFETFLMYHHIYVNPSQEEDKELRWLAWIYSSLLNRQSFPAESEFAIQQKAKDQETISKLKEGIKSSPAFSRLSLKQKNALLEKGSGKFFKHWSAIMEDTGYDKDHYFTHWYNFISTHAHSEGISIIQVKDSKYAYESNTEAAKVYLWVSKYIICSLIMTIRKLYQIVDIMYYPLPQQLRESIEFYAFAAKHATNQSN